MSTKTDKIINLLKQQPGLSDRQITDLLYGQGKAQQIINPICRSLESQGYIIRRKRIEDGIIGNYLTGDKNPPVKTIKTKPVQDSNLSEDSIKQTLETYLNAQGWELQIALKKNHGPDIVAKRGDERWVIEAKGCGSLDSMRVNYFLAILGEVLQRMDSPRCKYSIALPDMKQFRRLWDRLPILAKKRTGISALFINSSGVVVEETSDHA